MDSICSSEMPRRAFMALVSGALLAAPLAARAQQAGKIPRIGFLRAGPPPKSWVEGFQQGLRDLGYVEGQNIVTEYRFTDGSTGQLPDLVGELLRLKVDVIVASATAAAQAAENLTRTVPIVFAGINDPVGSGLVSNLSRPGKNITGTSLMSVDLLAKRVELLKEVVPQLSRLAALGVPADPSYALQVKATETGARALGVQLDLIAVRSPNDFETAFKVARKAQALIQFEAVFLTTHRTRLLELAVRNRLPAVYGLRDWWTAVASWPMGRVSRRCTAGPPSTWTRSSKAQSPATCLSSSRPSSSWSSTSRRPRRSASRSRRRCCSGRMRSSSRRFDRLPSRCGRSSMISKPSCRNIADAAGCTARSKASKSG